MIEPAFSLRRAGTSDLPGLLALEQASFSGDRLSARQYRHHLRHPRNRLLVAERGGVLLGSALVFLRAGSDLARLYSIAVADAARGQGLGAALLAAAEAAARSAGARRMRLEVRADNPAALGLYQDRGYRVFAQRPGYYEDGCAALRLEKHLAAATR
jgi:[ribosomal protein S18]-alanine N-acetyltransferase